MLLQQLRAGCWPNPELLVKIAFVDNWPKTARMSLFLGALGAFTNKETENLEDAILSALKRCKYIVDMSQSTSSDTEDLLAVMTFITSPRASRSHLLQIAVDAFTLGIETGINDITYAYTLLNSSENSAGWVCVSSWVDFFDHFKADDGLGYLIDFEECLHVAAKQVSRNQMENFPDTWSPDAAKLIAILPRQKKIESTKVNPPMRGDQTSISDLLGDNPQVEVDKELFAEYLANSLSLNIQEKRRVIKAFPELSQWQVNELIKVFQEEKEKFKQLGEEHPEEIAILTQKCRLDLTQLHAASTQRQHAIETVGPNLYIKIEELEINS
jgi:hypothetical protein